MADSSVKSDKKKKKKRKLTNLEEKPRTPKKHRTDVPEKEKEVDVGGSSKQKEFYYRIEAEHPWSNLQLILSLQNKGIDLQKLVSFLSILHKADFFFWSFGTIYFF